MRAYRIEEYADFYEEAHNPRGANEIQESKSIGSHDFSTIFQESKFRETGVLTPEEFVAAGDHLVHHCPTWSWCSGDETKIKPYLPKDKQFLITRNVPCYRRCKQMEFVGEETLVEGGDDSEMGEWVETHHYDDPHMSEVEEKAAEMTLDSTKLDEMENRETNDADDEEEAVDMEEFAESGMLDEVDPVSSIVRFYLFIAYMNTSFCIPERRHGHSKTRRRRQH